MTPKEAKAAEEAGQLMPKEIAFTNSKCLKKHPICQ
jgi:hypothetical protein